MSTVKLREIVSNKEDYKGGSGNIERAFIAQVLAEKEAVKLSTFDSPGYPLVSIAHPYIGRTSWIRCMPETGSECLTVNKPRGAYEILSYTSDIISTIIQESEADDTKVIRQLEQGEIEITSSGKAYTLWSADGSIKSLAGVLEYDLDMDKVEIRTRAPLIIHELHTKTVTGLGGEERFGVVKRPDKNKPYTLENYILDENKNEFQFEYVRWLTDSHGSLLVSLQEGNVYDETGAKVLSNASKPVRYIKNIADSKSQYHLTTTIDDALNIFITNDSPSDTKADIDFGVKNTLKLKTKIFNVSVAQSGNHTYNKSFTLKSPQTHIKSSSIKLGSNASMPVVLGPKLTSMLTVALTSISTGMTVLGADPALSPSAKTAVSTIATTLSQAVAQINSILSQVVMVE